MLAPIVGATCARCATSIAVSVTDDAIGTAIGQVGSIVAITGSASSPTIVRVQMKCRVAAEARDITATAAAAAAMRIDPLMKTAMKNAVMACLRVRGPVRAAWPGVD